MILKTAADNSG